MVLGDMEWSWEDTAEGRAEGLRERQWEEAVLEVALEFAVAVVVAEEGNTPLTHRMVLPAA